MALDMAWASLSPLINVVAEDVLGEALGEVVVNGVVVEDKTGKDVNGHKSVERLLLGDRKNGGCLTLS